MLVLALQLGEQVHDLGLHGHVERGGRLVGDQHLRVQRERHRDHDALAHAAGELVRVVVDPLLGGRDRDPVHQLDGLGLGVLAWTCPGARGTSRRSGSRPVKTGFSADSASWKIIAISRAADLAALLLGHA